LEEVCDQLMQAVVLQLVTNLEAWIMRKKFSFVS